MWKISITPFIVINVVFAALFIIVLCLSIRFGHFLEFISVFLAVLFGFYTSYLLVRYSEDIDRKKEVAKLSIAKLDMLRYLKQEIEDNITYMQEFDGKFKEASESKFQSLKQGWGNFKISFHASGIWNKFVGDFNDLEFIMLIDDEYIKYITTHKAIETFWKKAFDLIENYAIDKNSYTVEFKKLQIRYVILNTHIQKCIAPNKSSEKCLEAIQRKIAEINDTSTDK